jgi:hypothetical protein
MRRSKKPHFAFQTFTETPTTTPSTLGFGITHQPHGSEERSESHFETDMKVSVFWPLRVSVYSNLFFSQIT